MADNTSIEWADATINAVNGCDPISPGCTNCYAMRSGGRNLPNHPANGLTMPTKAGHVWTGEVRLTEAALLQPLRWKRPRRIFWNAHGDLFHDAVPDEWIDRVFAVCALTPQHQHMILTKRSERMRKYFTRLHDEPDRDTLKRLVAAWPAGAHTPDEGLTIPAANVWLGVSVEDQTRADERIPDLLATPAAIRFISTEPLLGPIDLTRIMKAGAAECFDSAPNAPSRTLGGRAWTQTRGRLNCLTGHYWGEDLIDGQWEGWLDQHLQASPGIGEPGFHKPIDWVIAGGESGPGARPMHPDWARSLRDQCAAAGVPFHFKQWGDFLPASQMGADGEICCMGSPNSPPQRIGKKRAGRLLDQRLHDGFPA